MSCAFSCPVFDFNVSHCADHQILNFTARWVGWAAISPPLRWFVCVNPVLTHGILLKCYTMWSWKPCETARTLYNTTPACISPPFGVVGLYLWNSTAQSQSLTQSSQRITHWEINIHLFLLLLLFFFTSLATQTNVYTGESRGKPKAYSNSRLWSCST